MEIAKKDIKLYKAFDGSNEEAESPIQCFNWGRLKPGRVLTARMLDKRSRICSPGVHASRLLHDAKLSSSNIIWEVIIPKGTEFYRGTPAQGRRLFDINTKGSIYRAKRVKLIRQVFEEEEI